MKGEGYYRLMADQSRRAHDFDRRMRWFWLRWLLLDREPEVPAQPAAAVTPTMAPLVPLQRG